MSAIFWLKLYLLTIPVFFVIDMVWLGYAARNFYKNQLHHLLSPEVNWQAAFLFYLIYIVGILFFAVRPGLEAGSLSRTCILGALFGALYGQQGWPSRWVKGLLYPPPTVLLER